MKQAGVSTYQLLFTVLATCALFTLFSIPVHASALELSAATRQLLPPGGSSCAQVTVSNFTPYIYNGSLDSFEFTISDPSYVALIGSVGQSAIPFNFITRRFDASGDLRIHVDIASTPVTGTLPLTVTLLSAKTGQPVCMTVVSMSVGSGAVQTLVPAQGSTQASTQGSAASSAISAAVTGAQNTITTAPSQGNSAMPTSTSLTQRFGAGLAPALSAVQNPVRSLCTTAAGAYRLWLILLVVYALLVGLLLWAEFPMSWSWAQTPERVATTILVLLVLLLGFWYLSSACRAALWMPLVAFLIAILGLLAAFWNHPRVAQMLLQKSNA